MRGELQPHRHLVRGGNADILDRACRILHDPAAFIQRSGAVDLVKIVFRQPFRVVLSALFIRFGKQNDVAV